MKEKIKNGLIVVLVILIVLFGFFGGRKVIKYQQEINSLKLENRGLNADIAKRDVAIEAEQTKVKAREKTIDSLMLVFRAKDIKISGLTGELNDALAKLNGITSDESYLFLTKVAYNYPGLLEYLFNETQIRQIHADYLRARNMEKIIPVYESQIANCKTQFLERDRVEIGLRNVIDLKELNLADCQKVNQNSQTVIKDTEKQRDKERGRKGFWRATSAVLVGAAIVLGIL